MLLASQYQQAVSVSMLTSWQALTALDTHIQPNLSKKFQWWSQQRCCICIKLCRKGVPEPVPAYKVFLSLYAETTLAGNICRFCSLTSLLQYHAALIATEGPDTYQHLLSRRNFAVAAFLVLEPHKSWNIQMLPMA